MMRIIGRRRPARSTEGGTTLVVTLTVVTVLTLVAAAAVDRGTIELEGAGVRRHYAEEIGCVEAARQLVISQLNSGGVSPTTVAIDRMVGDLKIKTGHYDSTTNVGQITLDNFAGNCGTGPGGTGAGALAAPGKNYGDTSVGVNVVDQMMMSGGSGGSGGTSGGGTTCGIRVPVTCTRYNADGTNSGQMLELEFLVRIAF